jgi:hypothetical protein
VHEVYAYPLSLCSSVPLRSLLFGYDYIKTSNIDKIPTREP